MSSAAIVGFGRYLPCFRISAEVIAEQWEQDAAGMAASLGVQEKTVPDRNEDSFTMAFEAGRQAISTAGIRPVQIGAVFVGSESHPYAVKPTSAMLASALEVDPYCHAADLEFACKAGTAALQIVQSFVASKQIQYGMAVGTDAAQAHPGDALEYTAAAGAAAFIVGPSQSKKAICSIDHTLSFTTDTPDFWRAADEDFPRHAGRFTGEPGYMHHMRTAIQAMFKTAPITAKDIDHVVLHMPNAKFPSVIAREFGFTKEQMQAGFVVPKIGNTYSACSLLGLAEVLEQARKGQRILLVAYGSGAGSDAFLFTMLRDGVALPPDERPLQHLAYGQYLNHRHMLTK